MTAQPGDEPGNVVAWKDFKKPANIPDEEVIMLPKLFNFRVCSIGTNQMKMRFTEPFPAYIETNDGCCQSRKAITLTMWLALQRLPVTLFSIPSANGDNPSMMLRILSDEIITLYFRKENASLGNMRARTNWNFLAFSWSNTGDLHCNVNGVHQHISSNFAVGDSFVIDKEGGSIIGGKRNESILGSVAQVNLWNFALPPPALMALSYGINGIGSYGVNWNRYSAFPKGNAKVNYNVGYYTPDFIAQKKRDQHCNDVMSGPCVGKYRARYGMPVDGKRSFGCFCEENLSKDRNFNHGHGDYTEEKNLKKIV